MPSTKSCRARGTRPPAELGDYYGKSVNDGSRIAVGEVAQNLTHWWSGQGDPIYKVSGQLARGDVPSGSDLRWAVRNLESAKKSFGEGTDEYDEATDLISALEDIEEQHKPKRRVGKLGVRQRGVTVLEVVFPLGAFTVGLMAGPKLDSMIVVRPLGDRVTPTVVGVLLTLGGAGVGDRV